MERAGRVGCADVEVDAVGGAAVAGFATRRLEHLARDLVDRRVAVRAKRRVHRAGAGRHFVARGVDVVEPIQAHDPLGPAVRTGTDDVVVCLVDQRGRAGVCRLVRRAWYRVVDGQPRAISTWHTSAAGRVHALIDRGPAVRCRGGAIAGQRVQVGEVLFATAVEVDIRITAAGRVDQAGKRAGRRPGRNHAEGLALVDRSEPGAPLGAGAGRPADEDAALRIDADVRLAVGVDRIDDRRCRKGDAWRGHSRQAGYRCTGCNDQRRADGQRKLRTDHPVPPCFPQQRAC